MPVELVNAKCPNCGAILKVDSKKEFAECEFCNAEFLVTNAILNYNYCITNNIKADNVNITSKGDAEKERLLKNAATYEHFEEFDKAISIFRQVCEDYPDDYRGWLGLATLLSDNFNNAELNAQSFQMLKAYMKKVLLCSQGEQHISLQSQWDSYLLKRASFIDQQKIKLNDLQDHVNNINEKIKVAGDRIFCFQNLLRNAYYRMIDLQRSRHILKITILVL